MSSGPRFRRRVDWGLCGGDQRRNTSGMNQCQNYQLDSEFSGFGILVGGAL